jgi:peptide/nickel transport system substrate-binding protein
MFRRIARGAAVAAVLSVFVAPSLWAPSAWAQEQKGTLVFAVESLGAQTLDPILEGRPGNAVYQAVMYDSLVGFDLAKGGVGPASPSAGSSRPTASPGPSISGPARPSTTATSSPRTTSSSAWSARWRRIRSPRRRPACGAPIKSIEVIDDLTVKVNTTSPQIGLPAGLSRAVAPEGAIMPKAYIERVGEEEFRKKPVGSGRGSSCATCRATASSSPPSPRRTGAAGRTSRT